MNGSPENQMNDHAPDESEAGAEPGAEAVEAEGAVGAEAVEAVEGVEAAEGAESLEDQVAQAVADAAVQEAIADGAIAQALEETVAEDIEAAASLEQASDAAIQETYEEKVADAVAEGLEGDALADAVAQAAADADVQEAIADGAIAQALEETIVEDVQAAQTVEEVSDEGIAENLEERVSELVEASAPAEPAEAAVAPEAEEVEAPKVEVEAEVEAETTVRDPFRGPGDWYVVHTYAGYENKVKTNLESRIHTMQMEDKIFDVHIPMEDVMEIKGGKKQIVQRKVFPGYLLVKMTYDNDSWYVVRNTPGVTGFVAAGTGSKPTPLSRREVEKILAVKKEEVKPTFRLGFEEGDVVRIISGPFADFNGTISEINVDQSKLKVLVNIFDRETPVELGFDQVAKV